MRALYRSFLIISSVLILVSIPLLPARADDETPPADTADITSLQLILDFAPGMNESYPAYMTPFAGSIYFSANAYNGSGVELWRLDGGPVIDIYPGAGSSLPTYLVVYNNLLYFCADAGDGTGRELWKYDTINDASLVEDIYTGTDNSSNPEHLTVYGNVLYFSADGGDGAGRELWRYDPVNGAVRVGDLLSGSDGSNIDSMAVYKNELYLAARGDNGLGVELWKYNPTDGFQFVQDIYPGAVSSTVMYLTVYAGDLYFRADAGDGTNTELWKYNPLDGLQQAADIYLEGGSDPGFLKVYNGALYFNAIGGNGEGYELWKYDPVNGADLVADIFPGFNNSSPAYFTVFNNELYFNAKGSNATGAELWKYNNTATARFRPSKSYDGWVVETSENSSTGGPLSNNEPILNVGDDSINRQYRSVLSFNTASLPDNAVIVSATLRIRLAVITGTNPFITHNQLLIDIIKGAFSGSNTLQASDFQAAPSKAGAGSIPNLSDVDDWYTGKLAKTAFSYLNKTGLTQLRLRFAKDDNNDSIADMLMFYSADSTNYADFPVLEVKYYIP